MAGTTLILLATSPFAVSEEEGETAELDRSEDGEWPPVERASQGELCRIDVGP